MLHGFMGYYFYGSAGWFAMHLLRPSQESIATLTNIADHTAYRMLLIRYAHGILPFIMLAGLFTAGTAARYAANAAAKAGDIFLLPTTYFQSNIPLWRNFTENKVLVYATHRNLGFLFALWTLHSFSMISKLKHLSSPARLSFHLLILAVLA